MGYYNRLLESYSEMQYIEYLQQRFAWHTEVIEDIAWKSFTSAINRIERKVVLTKLVNRILAVNYVQEKRQHCESAKCKHCNKEETVSHLYHCNKPSRIQWRNSYVFALRKKLAELDTDGGVINSMADILTEYLDHGEVTPAKYDEKYHMAIKNQERIGFEFFFLGKISQQWLNLYTDIEPDTSNTQRYSWGSKIIELTLNKMIELWEIRNKEVHGETDEEIELIRKRRAIDEITCYFALKEKVCICDQSLFPDNFDDFLNKSSARGLKEWIRMNNGWIAASIKRRESGNLGTGPLLPWLGLDDKNTEEVLTIIRENRRRQVLLEEARKEAKKKERRKKRRENMITQKPKSKNNMKSHFKVLPKRKRDDKAKSKNATKHMSKKKFQNNKRIHEKRKQFKVQSVKNFFRKPINKIKNILQSMTRSQTEKERK